MLLFRLLILLVVLLTPLLAFAAPGQVTLAWDAPTFCADGSPFPLNTTLAYTLYQASSSGNYDFEQAWLAGISATQVTLSAPGKNYWVVTASCQGTGCCSAESEPSNEVMTHQTGSPKNAKAH